MKSLVIGFDSAWTVKNAGAIVGVALHSDGTPQELGPPCAATFQVAEDTILCWQAEHQPESTFIFIDQPTIVANPTGQRPVEHLVSSVVCRRYGAMQPANTSKTEMFGLDAPVWPFLNRFGGPANPLVTTGGTQVVETYPVLSIVAFNWMLPDITRVTGRLPKYNPQRRKTFSLTDWQYLCKRVADALQAVGLANLAQWATAISRLANPRKSDQDGLDACICLLGALSMAENRRILIIGDRMSGYVVVPYSEALRKELDLRCVETERPPVEWVRERSALG